MKNRSPGQQALVPVCIKLEGDFDGDDQDFDIRTCEHVQFEGNGPTKIDICVDITVKDNGPNDRDGKISGCACNEHGCNGSMQPSLASLLTFISFVLTSKLLVSQSK